MTQFPSSLLTLLQDGDPGTREFREFVQRAAKELPAEKRLTIGNAALEGFVEFDGRRLPIPGAPDVDWLCEYFAEDLLLAQEFFPVLAQRTVERGVPLNDAPYVNDLFDRLLADETDPPGRALAVLRQLGPVGGRDFYAYEPIWRRAATTFAETGFEVDIDAISPFGPDVDSRLNKLFGPRVRVPPGTQSRERFIDPFTNEVHEANIPWQIDFFTYLLPETVLLNRNKVSIASDFMWLHDTPYVQWGWLVTEQRYLMFDLDMFGEFAEDPLVHTASHDVESPPSEIGSLSSVLADMSIG